MFLICFLAGVDYVERMPYKWMNTEILLLEAAF